MKGTRMPPPFFRIASGSSQQRASPHTVGRTLEEGWGYSFSRGYGLDPLISREEEIATMQAALETGEEPWLTAGPHARRGQAKI
eukprot:539396-Amphidinium_carterae.1